MTYKADQSDTCVLSFAEFVNGLIFSSCIDPQSSHRACHTITWTPQLYGFVYGYATVLAVQLEITWATEKSQDRLLKVFMKIILAACLGVLAGSLEKSQICVSLNEVDCN